MGIGLHRNWLGYVAVRPTWAAHEKDAEAPPVPSPSLPRRRWPGSDRLEPAPWVKTLNRLLAKLRVPYALVRRPDLRRDMATLEQMANLRLLTDQVLACGVPGDFVELGCYTGASSVIIARALHARREDRAFHVYDRFDIGLASPGEDVRSSFEENIRRYGVPMPRVHKGDFTDTLPGELPERIAFAHIDCGIGDDPEAHARRVLHCLEGVFARLSQGGVVVLMDYHVPGETWKGANVNPGVREACDLFFAGRPEQVRPLYGGAYSHGYVRKV